MPAVLELPLKEVDASCVMPRWSAFLARLVKSRMTSFLPLRLRPIFFLFLLLNSLNLVVGGGGGEVVVVVVVLTG